MNNKIWLSSPHMGGSEMKYIESAFADNWIAPLGPNVNGFESDLENYRGHNVSVAALSSGTAALHLALVLLGVGKDDEVICQSLTFRASANSILYVGAKPILLTANLTHGIFHPTLLKRQLKTGFLKVKRQKR